MQQNTEKTNIV